MPRSLLLISLLFAVSVQAAQSVDPSVFKALEQVRRRIFRLKFFIKALNNFLTALTPFLFYSLGGYFVIEGRITLGALVAVLAAHKDFSAPLKELFRYYQALEDTRIRYQEITTFFAGTPPRMEEQQSAGVHRLAIRRPPEHALSQT